MYDSTIQHTGKGNHVDSKKDQWLPRVTRREEKKMVEHRGFLQQKNYSA